MSSAVSPALSSTLAIDLDRIQSAQLRSSSMLLPAPAAEDFRTLRTRLEQMEAAQHLQVLLVASPAPGDGKSFTAANLALTEAQLADHPTVLCDCDLRNPALHTAFGIPRSPGLSDCLLGHATLESALYRIGDSNLFLLPAGTAIANPLETLHLRSVRAILDRLRQAFCSIILDSPPLNSASDGHLLAAEADGTLLVARIGTTGAEALQQAIASIGLSRLLGIVANAVV